MKIIYISNSIIPSRTANSIHVMKMCQAFADNGHKVVLLAPDYKEQYEPNIKDIFKFYGVKENFKIKKIFTLKVKGRSVIYSLGILQYLLFNKTDLVYGRFIGGCYLASQLRCKTIFESHFPMWKGSIFGKILFNKLIKSKNFDKLVVISQALKNSYLKNGYLNDEKIQVAHDGADEVEDFSIKAELKGEKNNLKVGYVGQLYQGKGIEIIEKIADKVSDDIEFHIIGGFKKDIKFWKSKIDSTNVYFYGFIPPADVSSYMNVLDICILPNQKVVKTYNDGKKESSNIADFTSPLKMFEYMAHKKPIISSNLEVLREVLDDYTSILVNCESPQEWISAIDKFRNLEFKNNLAENAFAKFKQYTWKNRAKCLLKQII